MKIYTKELGEVKVISAEKGEVTEVETSEGIRVAVKDLPNKTITILTFLQYILQAIINFIKIER